MTSLCQPVGEAHPELLDAWHQSWYLPHTLVPCLVVVVIALGTFAQCSAWPCGSSAVGSRPLFFPSGLAPGMQKFLGQGSKPRQILDLQSHTETPWTFFFIEQKETASLLGAYHTE